MGIARHGIFRRLATGYFNTRKFRRLYFDTRPQDSLLLAQTDGGDFLVSAADQIIGRYCYVHRKPADFQKLQQVLQLLPGSGPRDLLVDIGANIGTIGIAAVRRGLFQRAVAIEPEPGNFRLLDQNVTLNGLENSIDTCNKALAAVDGAELVFELSADNHGDHRVRTTDAPGLFEESERPVISVESTTLDSLGLPLSADNSLIWMDVQGYEGAVLSGAASGIANKVPVCFEFSPYQLRRADNYDLLLQSLAAAPHANLVNLRDPSRLLEFSVAALEGIATELGFSGEFTDLLIW